MAAALVYFLPRFLRCNRCPFGGDKEIARDLQKRIKDKGPRFRYCLFHRENADEVIANAKVVAFGLDVRIDDLVVEKLGMLRPTGHAPIVVVKKSAKKAELTLLIQNFDLHEVSKLANECLHLTFESREVAFNLRPKQSLHAAVRELGLQFADGAGRIAEETSQCRTNSGLRPSAFKQDAIEHFDFVKAVALNGRLYDRVLIAGEWNLRTVGLEQVLIDMEARAKRFQRRLEPLHCIFLIAVVKAPVIHAGDAQDHAQVAAFGQKCGLVPKAIQIDMAVQRVGVSPRLDGSINAQHQSTSTRGTLCLAAS